MINLPTKEVEINGKRYRLRALAAQPGRKMLVRLTKVIGPGLAATLKSAGSGNLLQADVSVLAGGIDELCRNLSADEFDAICTVFIDQTEVMGDHGWASLKAFDAFAADYGSLFKLLAAHIDHNYSSFFAGLKLTAP